MAEPKELRDVKILLAIAIGTFAAPAAGAIGVGAAATTGAGAATASTVGLGITQEAVLAFGTRFATRALINIGLSTATKGLVEFALSGSDKERLDKSNYQRTKEVLAISGTEAATSAITAAIPLGTAASTLLGLATGTLASKAVGGSPITDSVDALTTVASNVSDINIRNNPLTKTNYPKTDPTYMQYKQQADMFYQQALIAARSRRVEL